LPGSRRSLTLLLVTVSILVVRRGIIDRKLPQRDKVKEWVS
ncbi:MAG: hypothetical protein ACI8ZV_001580, partial [Chitinophagales bacterium]